jgi:hypothetical protein
MLLIEATETLAQPWHIHHELPTGTFRVTAGEAVAVSNIEYRCWNLLRKARGYIVSPESNE